MQVTAGIIVSFLRKRTASLPIFVFQLLQQQFQLFYAYIPVFNHVRNHFTERTVEIRLGNAFDTLSRIGVFAECCGVEVHPSQRLGADESLVDQYFKDCGHSACMRFWAGHGFGDLPQSRTSDAPQRLHNLFFGFCQHSIHTRKKIL
jgi:hypothetical protein